MYTCASHRILSAYQLHTVHVCTYSNIRTYVEIHLRTYVDIQLHTYVCTCAHTVSIQC